MAYNIVVDFVQQEPPVPLTWEIGDPSTTLDRLPIEVMLRVIDFLDPLSRFELAQTGKSIRHILPPLELEDIIFVLHHRQRKIITIGNRGTDNDRDILVGAGCFFDGHYRARFDCYCGYMFRYRGVHGEVRAFERACEQGDLLVIKHLLKWRHFDVNIGRDYRRTPCDDYSIQTDGPFHVLASQHRQNSVALYLLEECDADPWAQDRDGRDMAYWDTQNMVHGLGIDNLNLDSIARQLFWSSDDDDD